MARRSRILAVLLVIALLLLIAWWAKGFIRQDQCLDNGGRWNAGSRSCEDARAE